MGFKFNSEEATQGNGVKPEGKYECIINRIEKRTTKNGAEGINFSLVIRNDIDGQKYKNAYLFHTIWKKKEPTTADMQVEGYNFGQLMAMGKAGGLDEGKDYENLDEYLKDLNGKCILATLKHEEYNGKTQERVSFVEETKYPECKHKFKKKVESDGYAFENAEETIDDEGVPF